MSHLLRTTVDSADSTYLSPSIPEKKQMNVRRVHAAHLPNRETILGLYDDTVFGSAKDGWLVTKNRLCWRNQFQAACFLDWNEVDAGEIRVDGSKLKIGRVKLESSLRKNSETLRNWAKVLKAIARSARRIL